MNNLTFGGYDPVRGQAFAYYETLGGGMGARPGADGLSGVHVHMSNTRNTPVEALEMSLPVRVKRYSLRTGSGGAGRYRGGDGTGKGKREVAEVLRLLVEQGIAFEGVETSESTLEDIFVDLVENRIEVAA